MRIARRRVGIIAAGVLLLLLIGVGVWQNRAAPAASPRVARYATVQPPTAAPTRRPIPSTHILFASAGDLYRTPADRAAQHLLGRVVEDDRDVAWSPDGTRIAFASKRTGDRDIYSADRDGTHITRLTSGPNADFQPTWSPDGKLIAFRRNEGNVRSDVYLMASDGSNLRQLTRDQGISGIIWSPTGMQLALVGRDGDDISLSAIFLVNSDGTNFKRLASGMRPTWSPDGTQLIFEYSGVLFRINADGTGGVGLTQVPVGARGYSGEDPAWSPDGRTIAFVSNRQIIPNSSRDLPGNVWLMNPDGTNMRRLTDITYYSEPMRPQWSPDGQQILFYQGNPGSRGIYTISVMNADGTNEVNVASGYTAIWDPQTE